MSLTYRSQSLILRGHGIITLLYFKVVVEKPAMFVCNSSPLHSDIMIDESLATRYGIGFLKLVSGKRFDAHHECYYIREKCCSADIDNVQGHGR